MNVTSATGKRRREGGREAGGGCRGSRAVVGWESLQSLPVWQKNPGESEMVKTKRQERSKVPEEAQTGSPGGECGTPLQLQGSPAGGRLSPAGRKGMKQNPLPVSAHFLEEGGAVI